jgi:hypothetical protein
VTAHTIATTHPTSVHPSRRFRAKIAPALRLRLPTNDGTKYKNSPTAATKRSQIPFAASEVWTRTVKNILVKYGWMRTAQEKQNQQHNDNRRDEKVVLSASFARSFFNRNGSTNATAHEVVGMYFTHR